MLVTIDSIPGKNLEVLGIVKGTIVQSKNFGRDFMASLKTLVGGEIAALTLSEMRLRKIFRSNPKILKSDPFWQHLQCSLRLQRRNRLLRRSRACSLQGHKRP